jgi:hypothetical protein
MTPTPRPMKPHQAWPGLAATGALAVLALLAWNFGSMATLVAVGTAPVPFNDQWDAAYFPDGWPGNLFDLHNEHRPALGRLIGFLDWRFAAGGNQINAAFILLWFPLFALTLYGLACAAGAARMRAGLAAGLGLALMASGVQSEDLLWGFQTAFSGSFVFELVTLAAALASVSAKSPDRAWAAFSLCLLTSLCAVFSLASGLLVLPAVLALLLIAKAPNGMRLGYSLFAAAVIAGYFHGYPHGPGQFAALHHLGALVLYVMSYLAAGIRPPAIIAAALIGLFGVCLLTVNLMVAALKARRDPAWLRSGPGRAYLVLLLYALAIIGAAGMAAVGRSTLGVDQALSSRYGAASLCFWADLVVLCILTGQGRLRPLSIAGWALGGVLALHTATTQLRYFESAHAQRAERLNGMIAYDLGVRDHPTVFNVYPVQSTTVSGGLDARFEEIRRARRSIFAQVWPSHLGGPIGAWTQVATRCNGFAETRVLVAASKPVLEVKGWSWDKAKRRTPDLIVFTDSQDRTIGFGASGYPRKDAMKALHARGARYSGWHGFAAARPDQTLRAYAVELGAKPTACLFAVSTVVAGR